MVTLSGWGRTDWGEPQSNQLQTAKIPIATCSWMGQYNKNKLPYFVCAGAETAAETAAETGTCKGDSGGPLAYKSDDGIYSALRFRM